MFTGRNRRVVCWSTARLARFLTLANWSDARSIAASGGTDRASRDCAHSESTSSYSRLTGHTTPDTDTDTTTRLLNRTGLFIENQGAMTRAIDCLERAHTTSERVLGADHPSTLAALG